jgi:glyoxylase-like metal-dependent hydrolase (beta-lactamase superfamily II)
MAFQHIVPHVYQIGGSDITDPKDCSIYLIDADELILIDTGAGASVNKIVNNIERLGLDPYRISTLILTHCHIDHIGGAHFFKSSYSAKAIMHELDADVVKRGDTIMTAAYWYGVHFLPLPVDVIIKEEEKRLIFGTHEIICLHTPGHTPGSLSVYMDMEGKRILFGQDIHGPFMKEFGSDLKAWTMSMKKLIALEADILCEGHFGVYQPREKVKEYIERYLDEYGE